MIKNIAEIISNNNCDTYKNISIIYYYCEGHENAGLGRDIDWNTKNVPICKNCDKFQCNLHIGKNRDLCMSCAEPSNICSIGHKRYYMCNYCNKIICDCFHRWTICKSNGNGSYFQVICDEHYEEYKLEPNVKIYGNGPILQ